MILGQTLEDVSRHLPKTPERVSYLILEESSASQPFRVFMGARGYADELPRARLFRERSCSFRSKYVDAIGRLNVEHAAPEWWAMPFTTKNPISSGLCQDVFVFLLLVELARTLDGCLVVIMDQTHVGELLARWGEYEGLSIKNTIRQKRTWTQWALRWLPLAIIYLAARGLWLKVRTGLVPLGRFRERRESVVLVTLVHPHSIVQGGGFRDTYWGDLGEWLKGRGISIGVAGIVQQQSMLLARSFQEIGERLIRFPLDSCITVGGVARAAWQAFQGYASARSSRLRLMIDGMDIGQLIVAALREAHESGEVFRSFYVYECAKELGKRMGPAQCFFPYENRAWEKMLLLGVRSVFPATKMVGYQHASITASHVNYMFADKEADVTPLPDAIVTVGKVTQERLMRGGYPQDRLRIGCALRRPKSMPIASRRPDSRLPLKVLVVLSGNLREYVRVLTFLGEGLDGAERLDIAIRPHPTISLDEAIRVLPKGWAKFRYTLSTDDVAGALKWCHVVVYASSTLGLEAIGAGVPSVYLDVGNFLDTDPMDGWTEFKWIVREPSQLASILAEIRSLPEQEYERRRSKGIVYVDEYLAPVTDERLQVFCQT